MALPLSMALAIASGVPPQHGLYTAIVAGLRIFRSFEHGIAVARAAAEAPPPSAPTTPPG